MQREQQKIEVRRGGHEVKVGAKEEEENEEKRQDGIERVRVNEAWSCIYPN